MSSDWRDPARSDPLLKGFRDTKMAIELMPKAAEEYRKQAKSFRKVVVDPLLKAGNLEAWRSEALVSTYECVLQYADALEFNMEWRFPKFRGDFLFATFGILQMLHEARKIASEAGGKWPASMDYVGRMDLKPMLMEAGRYPGIKEKLREFVKDVGR